MTRRVLLALGVCFSCVFLWASPTRAVAPAVDEAARAESRQAQPIIDRAITFLRQAQDEKTGGWSVPPAGSPQPSLPAITALVINGLLMQPGVTAADPAVKRGVEYILSFAQPDGGIYDGILPSYNTAICLSALARVDTPEAKAAIGPAQNFLRNSQWGTASPAGGKEAPVLDGVLIDADHPFYGGLGYGNRGRPDLSNLAFMLQAFADSGVPNDDPAVKRAVAFLQRCQMLHKDPAGKVVNDQPYAKSSRQGGFIYATAENAQTIGQGQSFAGSMQETLSDGTVASRLRAYGSVTYLGFKSYIYAGFTPNDPRVIAARDWARSNYTLAENPGIGTDGYYYYILAFARAMKASGAKTIDVTSYASLRNTLYVTPLPLQTSSEQFKALFAAHGKVVAVTNVVDPVDGGPNSAALVRMATDADAKAAFDALNGTEVNGRKMNVRRSIPGQFAGPREWRLDLYDQLATLQQGDGSFLSLDDRWMENNPVLVTAYALLALQNAAR